MKWRKLLISCLIILCTVSMLLPMAVSASAGYTISNNSPKVTYRSHVQDIGWQDWVADGALSGTTGLGLRMEAISVNLDAAIEGGVRIPHL